MSGGYHYIDIWLRPIMPLNSRIYGKELHIPAWRIHMCLDVKKVPAITRFQELGIPEEVVIHQALEQIPSDFILSKRVNGAPATVLRNADFLDWNHTIYIKLHSGDGWVLEDNSIYRITIPSTIKI